MHHQIDSLAYTNQLRSLPPEHKLGFAIALFLLGYVAPPVVQLLIPLWLSIWLIYYAKIPAKLYSRMMLMPITFLITSAPAFLVGVASVNTLDILQPDVIAGISLGSIYLYLSQQGWEQVSMIFLRAIALTSCLYFILFTIPMIELIRILKRCGCPALMTELMLLMYRFIFILAATASELLTAQQCRFGYGNWRLGLRSLSLLVGQLLQRTIDNYRQLSLGLASRGYNGELRVWHTRRYKSSQRYTTEAVGGYLFLLTLTGWHYRTALC